MTYKQLIILLKEKDIIISDIQINHLKQYVSLLLQWNEIINLTAITKEDEIIEKHLFDSYLPSLLTDFHHKNIVDIGSGAGFPGIPLAILFSDSKFVLLEPIGKKAKFLSAVVNTLQLENVTVVNERAENYKNKRGFFDIAISRAVAPLNILLELSIPLVKVEGFFVAMKSQKADDEINESSNAIKKLNCEITSILKGILPSTNSVRFNILFKKKSGTDVRYPRPYAIIIKRPL